MKVLRPASAGPNPGRIRQLVEQLGEFIGRHSKVERNLAQQTSSNLFVSMAGNHCEAAVRVFEYEMAPVDSFQPEPELGKGFDYFADLRRTKRQLPYSLGQLDPQLMGTHELRPMLRVGYHKVPFDCLPCSGVKLVQLPRLRVTSWQLYNRRYVEPILVLLHHDIERHFRLRFQGTLVRVL